MSLTQFIHRGRSMYGEREALVYGDRVTTYADLHQQVATTAGVLQGLSPQQGGYVGILSAPSDRAIMYFYASTWAGLVPNYLNIRWSENELAASLDDFRPEILVVDDNYCDMGLALLARCDFIKQVIHIGVEQNTGSEVLSHDTCYAQAQAIPDCSGDIDSLAFLNYTGGTTGKGKGVMITHNSHITALANMAGDGFFVPGNTLMAVPLFHISGIAVSNSAIMLGNTQYILPAFEPVQVMELIQRHKIVQALLVPTMLQMLVTHPRFEEFDLTSLRNIRYGASPISQALLMQVRDKLHWANLMQVYGQTECVPATLLHHVDHGDAGVELGRTKSAGIACLGVDIVIRDESASPLPPGEVGEITLRANWVMEGYLGMPEQTAEALRDGWVYTGDAGYVCDAGYLYVVDRIKDMIVTGGENVYSAEVENAISKHPSVAQCAVVGLPDDKWGERVHAEIVLRPGQSLDDGEIVEFCRDYLAGYKIPKSFRMTESIPLTAVGKVDKVAIRKLAG